MSIADNGKSDKHILFKKLETMDFGSKLDFFINKALLEHYFEAPDKILDAIDSFLSGLFGSFGEDIINSSITKVCNTKENFKKEHLKGLISAIGEFLGRKISTNQAEMIKEQIKETFITKLS